MSRVLGADTERLGLQRMTVAGRLDWLPGGTPDEVPQRYTQVSPLSGSTPAAHPRC